MERDPEIKVSERSKSKRKQNALLVLVALMAVLTIGYSVVSTNLTINGTSKIKNSTWEVEPGDGTDSIKCPTGEKCTINPQDDDPSVDPETLEPDDGETPTCTDPEDPTTCTGPYGAIIWMDGNEVNFKHLLVKPTDTFTFDVDFENNGTIDAKIADNGVTMTGFSETAAKFLDYSVVYKGTDTVPRAGDALAAGEKVTFTVTVTYKSTVTKLPTEEELAQINGTTNGAPTTFTVTYEQA